MHFENLGKPKFYPTKRLCSRNQSNEEGGIANEVMIVENYKQSAIVPSIPISERDPYKANEWEINRLIESEGSRLNVREIRANAREVHKRNETEINRRNEPENKRSNGREANISSERTANRPNENKTNKSSEREENRPADRMVNKSDEGIKLGNFEVEGKPFSLVYLLKILALSYSN